MSLGALSFPAGLIAVLAPREPKRLVSLLSQCHGSRCCGDRQAALGSLGRPHSAGFTTSVMAKQQTQWRGGSEPRVQAKVVVSGRWGSSPKGVAGPGVRRCVMWVKWLTGAQIAEPYGTDSKCNAFPGSSIRDAGREDMVTLPFPVSAVWRGDLPQIVPQHSTRQRARLTQGAGAS